jgi:hypothetical protein
MIKCGLGFESNTFRERVILYVYNSLRALSKKPSGIVVNSYIHNDRNLSKIKNNDFSMSYLPA